MREKKQTKCEFRWKQFNRKAYAVFVSLTNGKNFSIGVLAAATLTFANVDCVSAQNLPTEQVQSSVNLEEVEVAGTRTPLTEKQAARMVTVLSRSDIQAAAVHSINDLLEYATGIDVRQRGELGVQTDISIHGGTFDQITLLLNGVNITNPQTGHLSADFPVSMDDIERIEVLEGPAARVFGTSAFSGAINIVTKNDKQSHVAINLMGGAYGLADAQARVNFTKGRFSHQLSGGYRRTDGATVNSDLKGGRAYYQGTYSSDATDVRWQLSYSDQAFGANTFYGATNDKQWEAVQQTRVSVQAETKGWLHLMPTIYWNRSNDHYQWIRNTPTGENYHLTDVYGSNLNAYFTTALGKTSFGAEVRNEGILSTNLGRLLDENQRVDIACADGKQYTKKDSRTSVGYYVEHNILLPKATISLGLMANMNTYLDHQFRYYPGVDISYRPTQEWKLFASWNKALRLPTFTDLYYRGGNLEGNLKLKPERTQAYTVGAQYRNAFIDARISGFYHNGHDMIDWVRLTSDDRNFYAFNFDLDNMGVEVGTTVHLGDLVRPDFFIETFSLGYTYIHQNRHDPQSYYLSNYAGEYLRHKVVAKVDHWIWKHLKANWALRWQQRMGAYESYVPDAEGKLQAAGPKSYPAYCLVDLKLTWTEKNYAIYAEAANLLNQSYFDLGGIPQPGIWVRGGLKYRFNL